MASLDNFHTNNGGAWRDKFHVTEKQAMNTIGLGLDSPDRWDLSCRVPYPSPSLDKDRHKRQQPQPYMAEARDTCVRDLYVQLQAQNIHAIPGDNVNSIVLYDAQVHRMKRCPMRKIWAGMKRCHPDTRYRPY